jgi:hypothetical protein
MSGPPGPISVAQLASAFGCAREGIALNILGEIRAELERCLSDAGEGSPPRSLPVERLRWLKAMCRLEIVAARLGPGDDVGRLVEFVRSTHGLRIEFRRRIDALVARSLRAIESNDALRGP